MYGDYTSPRAATARPVSFKIPAELQAYLEVLPANSMVQGNDSLSVQLKFCPGQPLLQSGSARDQFSGPGNCWKMDIRVDVGGQVSQWGWIAWDGDD